MSFLKLALEVYGRISSGTPHPRPPSPGLLLDRATPDGTSSTFGGERTSLWRSGLEGVPQAMAIAPGSVPQTDMAFGHQSLLCASSQGQKPHGSSGYEVCAREATGVGQTPGSTARKGVGRRAGGGPEDHHLTVPSHCPVLPSSWTCRRCSEDMHDPNGQVRGARRPAGEGLDVARGSLAPRACAETGPLRAERWAWARGHRMSWSGSELSRQDASRWMDRQTRTRTSPKGK